MIIMDFTIAAQIADEFLNMHTPFHPDSHHDCVTVCESTLALSLGHVTMRILLSKGDTRDRKVWSNGVFESLRCLVHHPHELQNWKSPRFLAAYSSRHTLLVVVSQDSESQSSSVRLTIRLDIKNCCARKEIYFLCICTMLDILMSIPNALTHLITLLL